MLAVLDVFRQHNRTQADAGRHIAASLDRQLKGVLSRLQRDGGASGALGNEQRTDHPPSDSSDSETSVFVSLSGMDDQTSNSSLARLEGPAAAAITAPYSRDEVSFLRRTYMKYRRAGKQRKRCIAVVAKILGRSIPSVKTKTDTLRRAGELPMWDQNRPVAQRAQDASDTSGGEEDRGSASASADMHASALALHAMKRSERSQASRLPAKGTRTHVNTGTRRKAPLTKGELVNALRVLPLPDLSDRRRVGSGFRYSPDEVEYMLEVQRLYRRARVDDEEEMKDFLAGKLQRTRLSIDRRFVELRGTALRGGGGDLSGDFGESGADSDDTDTDGSFRAATTGRFLQR
jgi:hypothetical protein